MDMQIMLSILLLGIIAIASYFYLSNFYHIIIRHRPPLISSSLIVYGLINKDLANINNIKYLEIGSGRGVGLNYLSKNKTWKLMGYEIAIFPYLYSKLLNKKNINVVVLKDDIFNIKEIDANVVYIYMFKDFNNKIEPILTNKLKKGTLIYSYGFTFSNLNLLKIINVTNALHKKINVYKI